VFAIYVLQCCCSCQYNAEGERCLHWDWSDAQHPRMIEPCSLSSAEVFFRGPEQPPFPKTIRCEEGITQPESGDVGDPFIFKCELWNQDLNNDDQDQDHNIATVIYDTIGGFCQNCYDALLFEPHAGAINYRSFFNGKLWVDDEDLNQLDTPTGDKKTELFLEMAKEYTRCSTWNGP
jgi:hypothetical protein